MSRSKMRIAIFSTMPPKAYSGGRYHALMMAEALAHGGHETHVVSDCVPLFYDDLACLPAHDDVQFHVTPDFRKKLPDGPFDFVFLIPGIKMSDAFSLNTELFALQRGAYLAFINFEAGNWFNSLSPFPRDLKVWEPWQRICKRCALIVSSAKESDRWAREFYSGCLSSIRFDWCYPAINTAAADSVRSVEREKRIVFFVRFSYSEHKGVMQLQDVICEAMRGYTLVFMVGGGSVPPRVQKELERCTERFGVGLEFLHRLSDVEKFTQIKRAQLMLFPSYFEGFGYPPIEAQYCNTPCVAFDLPVLRETSGDGLIYARHGDWDDFRQKVIEVLSSARDYNHLHDHIRDVASLDTHKDRLNSIMLPFLLDKKPSTRFDSSEGHLAKDPDVKVGVSEPIVTEPEIVLSASQKRFILKGWYAAPSEQLVALTVNGEPFAAEEGLRPDVEARHPGSTVVRGFTVCVQNGTLKETNSVELLVGGSAYWSKTITLAPPTPAERGLRWWRRLRALLSR